ncbi:MAG: hypothetical protein QF377_02390, partial [Candidatus Thalassarchaeum sp.]|nr:hypothetical protein [Candidatus Thalassarchaeum sp.]
MDAMSLRNDADYQSSDAFALAMLPELPLDWAPEAERSFLVEFTPMVDGQDEEAVLRIESNDPYQPVVDVAIRGS